MADPLRGTIIEDLKRDEMHSRDIASALEFLRESLGREGIPFGLIGPLALRYHGYSRFTEDIDILTTREGLESIHQKLVGRGLVPRSPGARKKLLQARYRVKIDVVTAGDHAGSKESPTVFPPPESDAFVEQGGIRVVNLEKLIELKIASGIWGHRVHDLGDVQSLIQVNGLTEAFADKLPVPLRPKYLEVLAQSRLERELE